MSLIAYNQPKGLDLAGNHLFFKVKGTDYLVAAGEKAQLRLSGGIPANAEFFSLTFKGRSHHFYLSNAVPIPVPEGYDMVIPSNVVSVGGISHLLANYPPLSEYYEVETLNPDLLITAKAEGEAFTIIADMSGVTAWSVANERAGENRIVRENYHVKALFSLENLSEKGTFVSLPEFRLDPDSNQLVELEVGEIIRRRFLNYFDLPDFILPDPVKAQVATMAYKLSLNEMSGTTVLSALHLVNFSALKGKVNRADHPDFDLREWINSNKRFLTNQPGRIYTWLGAKHYLYWLNPMGGINRGIRIKVEMISAVALEPETYWFDLDGIYQDEVIIIPVTDIVMAFPNGDQALEAHVSVVSADGITLAGLQSYQYLPKRLHARAFLFQNRLSGFDTVTTQYQQNTLKVTKDENRRILTQGYSRYQGDLSSDEGEAEDIFTAETGPIPAAMADHFKEMANSGVVFLQGDDRFIRIWIEKGSFKLTDETDDLQNVKFKYKSAFAGDLLNSQLKLPEAPHKDYADEYLKNDYQ